MSEMTVFVRIGLYLLAGRMIAGGWMPQFMATEFTSPAMVEMASGAIAAMGTGAWYWFSKARESLREWT